MEQEVPVHSNKKIILLAIGAIGLTFLFLVIAIIAVNSSSNNNNSQVVSDNQSPQNPQDNIKDPVATDISVQDGWRAYRNSNFSINLPSTWKIQEISFPNGDTGVSIQPNDFSPKKPLLMVVRSNRSPADTAQMQQAFVDLGFESKVMSINNVQARKFNGTIPPKTASSSATADFTQVNHIYFDKAESDYLIKYTYTSREIDQSIEGVMDEIISSFNFN